MLRWQQLNVALKEVGARSWMHSPFEPSRSKFTSLLVGRSAQSSQIEICGNPVGAAMRRVSRWTSRLAFVSLSFAVSTILVVAVRAETQQGDATEYQVKAAYLYNFGKFVGWPASASEGSDRPFEICVLGDDPFGNALDAAVAGATIHGNSVVTKRISKADQVDDCRIVFISTSETSRLPEVLADLDKSRVLTVSDIPQFSQRGGMIQFVFDRNRVRFEINVTNAEDAGLSLSSELLKVAVRVTRTPRRGM